MKLDQIKKTNEDSFNAIVAILIIIVIELFVLIFVFDSVFHVFPS